MTTSAASELAVAPRAPMATPDVGARQGGRVVDAVADHDEDAFRVAPLADHGIDLVGRGALREDRVDADGGRHQVGHAVVVAGDHDDPSHAHAPQASG